MKFKIQMQKIRLLIESYDGQLPFAVYFKQKCREHKNWGSQDRRFYRAACYSWWRLGRSLLGLEFESRWVISWFLTEQKTSPFWLFWCEELQNIEVNQETILLVQAKKLEIILEQYPHFDFEVFPFLAELGNSVIHKEWALHYLTKPLTWIRLKLQVVQKASDLLNSLNMDYIQLKPHSIGFLGDVNLEDVGLSSFCEVQDLNSQKCAESFLEHIPVKTSSKIWDCCSASGGKSLAIMDLAAIQDRSQHLFVSDIRAEILNNLKTRFAKNGLTHYAFSIQDLSKATKKRVFEQSRADKKVEIFGAYFDAIWADVPCTGSGTWGRDPENLSFFDTKKIAQYSNLQLNIVQNAVVHLNPGGHLFYSTCSVFSEENELNIQRICDSLGFKLIQSQLELGVNDRADSLFWAVLQKK